VSTLQQSKLRIDRAQKKLTELEIAIQSAWKGAAKLADEQADPNARDFFFRFQDQLRDEAALIISEFALHARTALDYIVFALAWRDTGGEQKRTQFPINEFPKDFVANRQGCLKHLTDEHVTMIEEFQPYKGLRLRPLLTLHRLSNRDKHRQFAHITFLAMVWQDPILQTKPASVRAFQVSLFEEGAEIEDLQKMLADILAQVTKIVDHFDGVLG
jgi:hypothetical protein